MSRDVHLRAAAETDLPVFFEHQRDPDARRMAAFTSKDPDDRKAFLAHWSRILAEPTVVTRTVEVGGGVAGHVASFVESGRREVTYWVGREHWGKGVATNALGTFLKQTRERPIYARVAADNLASLRVLHKCGFAVCGEERGFANARGEEIAELVLRLE